MQNKDNKEKQILVAMRKVLGQIIKDTTPPDKAMKHPLSQQSIHMIQDTFALIASRENELAALNNEHLMAPHFADEKLKSAEIIPISTLTKKNDE